LILSSGESEGRVVIREEADVGFDPRGIAIDVDEEVPYLFRVFPADEHGEQARIWTHRRTIGKDGKSATAKEEDPGGTGMAHCGATTSGPARPEVRIPRRFPPNELSLEWVFVRSGRLTLPDTR
jgi:hypothetical protein